MSCSGVVSIMAGTREGRGKSRTPFVCVLRNRGKVESVDSVLSVDTKPRWVVEIARFLENPDASNRRNVGTECESMEQARQK